VPVVRGVGDRIRLGQRSASRFAARVLAIVSGGRLESLSALAINRGDLLMLGSIALWSAYTALLRRSPRPAADGVP